MMCHISRLSGRFCLFLLVLGAGLFCALSAEAAPAVVPVTGCDPAVWTAMTAKAQAEVAYDTAVTNELINKPDSVLTLTCFSAAAGVSANKGGAIFSGDFTTQLQTVMSVTGGGTYSCTALGDLENNIITQGVDTGAPFATFDDLMSGTVPTGGGADFNAGWNAAKTANVFKTLQTAVGALPTPTALSFSSAKSSCDVLKAAGIVPSCP